MYCVEVFLFFPPVDIKLFKRFSFPHWNILSALVKNQLFVKVCVYFWLCYSIIMAILHRFWLSHSLEFRKYAFSIFVLCFQDWFGGWGPFYFHINFRSISSMSTCKKKSLGNFLFGLDLNYNLGRIYILTILTELTLEHGLSLLLFITHIIPIITETTKPCCRRYDDCRLCPCSQRYVVVLCVGALQVFCSLSSCGIWIVCPGDLYVETLAP